jgi:hypothetical protein
MICPPDHAGIRYLGKPFDQPSDSYLFHFSYPKRKSRPDFNRVYNPLS